MATRVGFGFAKPNSRLPVYKNHRRELSIPDTADLFATANKAHADVLACLRTSLKAAKRGNLPALAPPDPLLS